MNDERIHRAVRDALERDVRQLDMGVTARLAAARARALEQVPRRRRWHDAAGWAVAATLVLAVSVWFTRVPDDSGINAEDFDMLLAAEDVELYEDLEFYAWLSSENGA